MDIEGKYGATYCLNQTKSYYRYSKVHTVTQKCERCSLNVNILRKFPWNTHTIQLNTVQHVYILGIVPSNIHTSNCICTEYFKELSLIYPHIQLYVYIGSVLEIPIHLTVSVNVKELSSKSHLSFWICIFQEISLKGPYIYTIQ